MAVSRRGVSIMDRLDLEEKYIGLSEENQLLKKHARAQEDKIKRLATKLIKLTSDDKRELSLRKGSKGRAIELEDTVIELQERVRELEKHKANLMGKVSILRQQLDTRGKRHTHYDRVQPKVQCGISKTRKKSFSTEDMTALKRPSVSTQVSPGPVRYGRSVLEDARKDNKELEELVLALKREVGMLQEDIEHRKEQNKLAELNHEKEVLQLREQVQLLKTTSQKENLDDNVDKIRLQREARVTSVNLQSLELQHTTLEKNYECVKNTREKLMEEVKLLNLQLKQEQNHSSDLSNQLHTTRLSMQDLGEYQQLVSDLRIERDILKQSNERLMKSALTAPIHHSTTLTPSVAVNNRPHQLTSMLLEETIREAEEKLKQESDNHKDTIQQLQAETKLRESVSEQLKQFKSQFIEMECEYHTMRDRLTQYCQGSVDWTLIEEAIMLHKDNLQKVAENAEVQLAIPLPQTECTGQCHEEVQELRVALADTTNELNKSNKLLSLQNTISQDYKRETEALRGEMSQVKRECDNKLREQAKLLEIRSAQIKKLESQLKDITYSHKSTQEKLQSTTNTGNGSIVELSPAQNILTAHIGQLILSSGSTRCLYSSPPSLFLSLSMDGHKTLVSLVKCSHNPIVFGFTATYNVTMDDKFIRLMNTGAIAIELYQVLGKKKEVVGNALLPLRSLMTYGSKTVHDKIHVRGAGSLSSLASVGTLSYWVKLQTPITQSNRQDSELVIRIIKCTNLPSSVQGQPPMPYVMYKFHDYPDHDTPTVLPSVSPHFNDTHTYGVTKGSALTQYLTNNNLEVYVFDNRDSSNKSYIGMTTVPLQRLVDGSNSIKGTYKLHSGSGNPAGHITISIVWGSTGGQHSPSQSVRSSQDESSTEGDLLTDSQDDDEHQLPLVNERQLTVHSPNSNSESPLSTIQPEVSQKLNQSIIEHAVTNTPSMNETVLVDEAVKSGKVNDNVIDDISLTPTSSEIEEELTGVTDEDTLFEETAMKSNDLLQSQPSVKIMDDDGADNQSFHADSLDLSSSNEDPAIQMISPPTTIPIAHDPWKHDNFKVQFSLTVLSFTLEEGSSLVSASPPVNQVFIEYQFLDYDGSELETPTSQPLPLPGETTLFNFTKEFTISSEDESSTTGLLIAMLHSDSDIETRIPFTVVSDPPDDDSKAECDEIGLAELDFVEVLRTNNTDHSITDMDVYNINDESDIVGYLTVSLSGITSLRTLLANN